MRPISPTVASHEFALCPTHRLLPTPARLLLALWGLSSLAGAQDAYIKELSNQGWIPHGLKNPTIKLKYTYKPAATLNSSVLNTAVTVDPVCDYPDFSSGTAK